jgi:TonB-linked SusC/RagA family outer membrane protein
MKKNGLFFRLKTELKQKLLIMKLTAFFLIATCFQVSANGYSQNVTISVRKVPIEKVFKEIEKQCGYVFFYNEKLLKKAQKITLDLKNSPLTDVLDLCFKGQPFSYAFDDKYIIVKYKEPPVIEVNGKIRPPAVVVVDFPVTGRVIDAEGNGLPGATILLRGANRAIATGPNGNFSLQVPENGDVLVVSFVGYETKEIPVTRAGNITVLLAKKDVSASEVVVVGYGTQRRRDVTGAISSIKGGDLTQLSTQRVDQALQGRAAGVLVQNTDGAPGGNTTIRIRGMNSINGGNNALIVIDGLQGANLNSLNPNDIESIEILKDASATAIYGAQGANGVVLITTKLGKRGKPVISYDYSYGQQKLRRKLPIMNAADFARTTNEFALSQNGNGATPTPLFSDAQIQEFEKTGGTDWQDVIYRTAPIQNHQLSISGGTENLKYLVSGGYLDQKGILLNSQYNRFSLRANLQADINAWSNFGLTWAGSKETGNTPPFGSANISMLGQAVNVAPRWAPTVPIYDSLGNYSVHPSGYAGVGLWNPLASAAEPKVDNNTNRNIINTFLEFKPLKGLSLRITGGATLDNTNNSIYHNRKTLEGTTNGGLGVVATSSYIGYQNSNILTYDKTFTQHHLTVLAVAEQQYSKFKYSSINASNFLTDETGTNDLAAASIVKPFSTAGERVLNSYLGRINYAFANKYLLTASYRADGSSVFGKNNKWGFFPSGSVAWKASEEEFIQNLNVFSTLKIRASWGITGNQAINPYQTLSRMSSGGNYPYNGTNVTDLGFFIANAPNPSLKWENTTQVDYGVDLSVLKGRLNLTFDYYKKTTEDLLMPRTLPGYSGFTSVIDNIGSVENKGIELELSGDPIVGAFRWNTGLNFSANRNKVLDLGGTEKLGYMTTPGGFSVNEPFMYLAVGQPFGQMYGYRYEGVWSQSQSKEAAVYGQLPGDQKFKDLDTSGTIDNKDFGVIGNAFPDFIFGWTNRLSYKNFELTFLIQGTKGNQIFNQNRIRMENPYEGTSARLLDRWTPQNQNTDIPAYIDQRTREQANLTSTVTIGSNGTDQRTSRWIEDGSYVRLKNIMLTYKLPKILLNELKLNSLNVFVSGTNLITITKYTGYDPEVSSYNGNDAQTGVDFANYPPAKIFSVGLNTSF